MRFAGNSTTYGAIHTPTFSTVSGEGVGGNFLSLSHTHTRLNISSPCVRVCARARACVYVCARARMYVCVCVFFKFSSCACVCVCFQKETLLSSAPCEYTVHVVTSLEDCNCHGECLE